MFDVAGHRGSVDPSTGSFPVCTILYGVALICVLAFGLLGVTRVQAGTLYRCVGTTGEVAYSSSAVGYHDCKKVSSFGATAPRRKPVQPAARVTLTQVSGTAATTARNLGADGAQPTTLAHAQGNVQTDARAVAVAQVQRVSLAAAHGAVATDAKPALSPPVAGVPGRWSYRQSTVELTPAASMPPRAAGSGERPRVLQGSVYRIVRVDGSVEYTNLRPPAGAKGPAVTMLFSYIATCVACDLHSPVRWGSVSLNLTAYADTIRAASVEYGVDEAFLRAIIHAESAFNPRALSIKGAQGLMQLMPGTASDMGVLDAFNTEQNIRGGARYLGLLLHDFSGNERFAAAAYNAGPGAVQRYSGVPPYAETMVYVERVGTLRKRYGEAIHPPLAARAQVTPAIRM